MHKLTRQASKRSEPATCCTCCKLPRLEGTQSAAARDRGKKPPPSTFRPSHLLASCECHDTSALAQNSTEHLALTESLSTNRKTPQAAQLLKNHIAVAPTFLANLKMTWWYSQLEKLHQIIFWSGHALPNQAASPHTHTSKTQDRLSLCTHPFKIFKTSDLDILGSHGWKSVLDNCLALVGTSAGDQVDHRVVVNACT